ncbi:MAG: iron chaperone [Clostridiales bacterium]|nr:iron chaperone [Clostridiales bacterium]
MKTFKMFLDEIDDLDKRKPMEEILNHVKEKFPQLKEEIKWNEPMFTDHGTFIIGFSIAKEHIAVAPEPAVISLFEKDIKKAGYSHTKGLFRIKWKDKIDFHLLDRIIAYNIEDKKDMTKFWR